MNKTVTIGITDCKRFDDYQKWIAETGSSVIRLSYRDKNFDAIERCDGILFSGGDEDIHPRFYNKNEYAEFCTGFDEKRDEFEFELMSRIEKVQLPLLGICRGLQIVNVYFGGTLNPDIPSFGKFNHSKFSSHDRHHIIQVDTNSALHQIVENERGEVNSAHHQCADRVSKNLLVSALSVDGVIESLEWRDKKDQPFLLLVQWHPERMVDKHHVFSKNIRHHFIETVKAKK